jgi:hypothetical protein
MVRKELFQEVIVAFKSEKMLCKVALLQQCLTNCKSNSIIHYTDLHVADISVAVGEMLIVGH